MDRYTRLFILASLVYLALGGALGALLTAFPGWFLYIRFAHVHSLLAGFMAMMVFGVGYFILPRFAARSLRWPSLVGTHFWLANASLLVMLLSSSVGEAFPSTAWTAAGHAGALAQALSFVLFSANLGLTLAASGSKAEARPAPQPEVGRPPAPSRKLPVLGQSRTVARPLGPGSPVAEWVDRKHGARELLIEAGLRPIASPEHLEMVRKVGVTLSHACGKHGIPLDDVLARLQALPDCTTPSGGMVWSPELIIGEVVARYPQTEEVLRRRFGEGCFTCPGFSTETLAQGAMMHGVEVEVLLADLRAAVGGD